MGMSRKEEAIIRELCRMSLDGKTTFDLTEMVNRIYARGRLPPPKHPDNAVAATLRNLGSKARERGLRLHRISGIGRGARGSYEFRGDFSIMLRQ
jgi:hypothetical protein